MRSMYGPDTLLLASKKPRIKELVAKSASMSEEEIMALDEKPDVIRGLLLINQFGHEQKKSTIAEKIADKMVQSSIPTSGGFDAACEIYAIAHEDIWIPVGSTLLEAKTGWHWAMLTDGRIFVSNNLLRISHDVKNRLTSSSFYVKQGTLADLHALERARLNKLGQTI